ncbi:hypothetical protein [Nocardioides alkalitolerans]|uniref:hypothetical protein n=1 Tax=Nocardioides alkalitolerans TaxID=281714 RepID=UPI0012F8F88B|nr:hypothetical protein [Nocardioides alkalitolerans]
METTEVTTDGTTKGTPKGTTRGRSTRARGTLLPRVRRLAPWVLAVALVAVGVVGLVQADDVRSTASAENEALVDAAGTAEVQAALTQGLSRVLSYDHTAPEATTAAADSLLSGAAREEFDTLYAGLAERAPDQELVLTARVQSVAVRTLTDDTAEALVFLDQTSTRATDEESTVSAAQLAVVAERDGSTWTITELTPL